MSDPVAYEWCDYFTVVDRFVTPRYYIGPVRGKETEWFQLVERVPDQGITVQIGVPLEEYSYEGDTHFRCWFPIRLMLNVDVLYLDSENSYGSFANQFHHEINRFCANRGEIEDREWLYGHVPGEVLKKYPDEVYGVWDTTVYTRRVTAIDPKRYGVRERPKAYIMVVCPGGLDSRGAAEMPGLVSWVSSKQAVEWQGVVAVHELGHSLGLDHKGLLSQNIMSMAADLWANVNYDDLDPLSGDQIARILDLYVAGKQPGTWQHDSLANISSIERDRASGVWLPHSIGKDEYDPSVHVLPYLPAYQEWRIRKMKEIWPPQTRAGPIPIVHVELAQASEGAYEVTEPAPTLLPPNLSA